MENNQDPNVKKTVNLYAKYSALAFQMLFTVGIFTYGGIWLDKYLNLAKPFCTIALSLLSVGISLFAVIRDFTKQNE